MSTMKRGLVVALALAVSGGAYSLSAQRGIRGGGLGLYGFGPRLGENIQLALEFQEDLGLTAEQMASLQELLAGIEQDVMPLEAGIDELRAQITAGEINQADGLVQLQELLGEYQTAAAPYRTGVTTILTADQHMRLQRIMWNTRPLQGQYLGRAGVGRGLGVGIGVGRGAGRGLGRGVGRGIGRGVGRGVAGGGRYLRRGIGRARVPLYRNRVIRRGGRGIGVGWEMDW